MSVTEVLPFYIIIALASYFYGNVNNAVIISKFLGRDVRKEGSGNPGTLNMSRTFGIKIGALVLVLDVLKGVVPALVATLVFGGATFDGTTYGVGECAKYIAGFFVVFGHVFPVIYKLKGGKGIASTIGFMFVCNWWVALICGALAIAFILLTKLGAIGSFIATVPPIVYNFVNALIIHGKLGGEAFYLFVVAEVCLALNLILILYAHRSNIGRLIRGKENKTDWSGMIKKAFSKKKDTAVAQTGVQSSAEQTVATEPTATPTAQPAATEKNASITPLSDKTETEDGAETPTRTE